MVTPYSCDALELRCIGLSSASRSTMLRLTGTRWRLPAGMRAAAIVAAVLAIGATVPQTARAEHGGGWHGGGGFHGGGWHGGGWGWRGGGWWWGPAAVAGLYGAALAYPYYGYGYPYGYPDPYAYSYPPPAPGGAPGYYPPPASGAAPAYYPPPGAAGAGTHRARRRPPIRGRPPIRRRERQAPECRERRRPAPRSPIPTGRPSRTPPERPAASTRRTALWAPLAKIPAASGASRTELNLALPSLPLRGAPRRRTLKALFLPGQWLREP